MQPHSKPKLHIPRRIVPTPNRVQSLTDALGHKDHTRMQYKTLGNTGLLVSTLCFGTMTIAGDDSSSMSENGAIWKAIGNVGQAGSDALIKASFGAGINFYDTVDVYLTPDELAQLDEVSALPPEYPGWMLPFQSANRLDPNIARPTTPADKK